LVVLASAVYANNPSSFDVFASADYLWFLHKFLFSGSDRERIAACDALHFLFMNKPCLVKFFAASKNNLDMIRQWIKHSFTASLISLLEYSDDKQHSEIVHRIFSNLKTPHGFPNIGKDSQSIDYLV
jgi:hypothetical protein